jgi:hypothetical protein
MCPEGSFAWFTFTRRLPAILESLLREPRWSDGARARLQKLSGSVPFGSVPAAVDAATPDGDFWRAFLHARRSARWIDLPFLEAEAIFYVALLDAVDPGAARAIDPFSSTKGPALVQAAAHLPKLAASVPRGGAPRADAIAAALRLSLAGNVADLSQLARTRNHSDSDRRLLRDDASAVVRLLERAPASAIVDLVLDNAGEELFGDLALIDVLLGAFPSMQIRAHYKPRPHFVSDATRTDWEAALAALESHPTLDVQSWWRRLDGALSSGRLHTATHAFWCRPSPWAELPADLRATLSQAHVIISKGDLNYRRYVEDRAWSHDTSASDVWLSDLPPVLALRVLKSELVVGLERAVMEAAARAEPDWLFSGRNAVVQLFSSNESSG